MSKNKKQELDYIDYNDPDVQREVLDRQRRDMWTPEQIESFAKHFKLKPGMRLLDAGCGWAYSLRNYGYYCMPGGKLVGLDRETALFERAREHVEDEGLIDATTFINGDIFAMPFDSNSFDISIAQIVLCHLNEPEQALDELIRVTKSGGCSAIFDNASRGGRGSSWDNIFKPTMEQRLFFDEMRLKSMMAKKKLHNGDWSIGCYIPLWMSERGLKNISARQNEKVHWIAPPYDSPDQQTDLRNMKERRSDKKYSGIWIRKGADNLRALGVDEKRIERYIRARKRRRRLTYKALDEKRIAFASSHSFWCIWGFKP